MMRILLILDSVEFPAAANPQLGRRLAETLAEMGHEVEILNTNISMGRGQIIRRLENGVLAGATEPRCDGTVAAW